MLKSSLLAISSVGLIASAFFYPNQSVGLFAGGAMGGVATVYVADKERSFNKRLRDIEIKERNISDAQSTINYLKSQYQAKAAELDNRKKDLDKLETELRDKQQEINRLESDRLLLEQEKANLALVKEKWAECKMQEEIQLRSLQQQLDDAKAELRDKQRHLVGLAGELEQQQKQLEELQSHLAQKQERNQLKETELEKRRGEFEQGKQSYEDAVRRAEEAKVELYIIKEVKERSRPILEDLDNQRLDLLAQKEEFQVQLTQKQVEQQEFANRTQQVAQMLEEQAAADEEAREKAFTELEDAKQQALEEVQQVLNAQAKKYEREIMLRDRALLITRSMLAQSRIPDLIIGDSLTNDELLANRAIEKALAIHGIIAKEPYVKSSKKGFELHFKVLPFLIVPPERQVKGSEIPVRPLSDGEALMLIGKKVLPDLIAAVPGTSVKRAPIIDITQYGLRIIFDTTGVDLEEKQPKDPYSIAEPPRNHILKFFRLNTHIGLVGPTNIGKSTSINNILNLMEWDLQQENGKPTHIIVADTKPSRQLEAWRPEYIGEYEGLSCLKRVRDEIKARRDSWIEDYRAQKPYRDFDCNYIFFIDEINLLLPFNDPVADEHKQFLEELGLQSKKAVSALLLEIWRLGREFGVRLLIAGQNLKADVFGINILDLANLGWIYCGEAIEDFIRNCTVRDDKKAVEIEYSLRVAKYRHTQERRDKHFALFKGDGSLYFAYTLAADEWQEVIAENQSQSEVEEVIEGLEQTSSNPTNDGDKVSGVDDEVLNLLKRRLEESLSLPEGGLEDEDEEAETIGFLEWNQAAEPTALVDEAKEEIVNLICQGMTKPKDICLKVWGEKVNFQSKPYNGKNGVKVLIENLVKSAKG
jgi:hypothetical protein